ncbi:hypothetical protein LCGC14_0297990 [marine sediment metagenome]|uniref:Uncharacterized protein n=1 Tax=marine sediment metagenome TaxID=412755 RepID=A0A0F9TR69_9ZZZZ
MKKPRTALKRTPFKNKARPSGIAHQSKPREGRARKKPDPNSPYQLKKADNRWSKVVREKADYKCLFCGRSGRDYNPDTGIPYVTNAHHMIPKGVSKFYRHNINNGICLCFYCHKHHEEWSPHANKTGFWKKLKKVAPVEYRWYMKRKDEVHPSVKVNYKQVASVMQDILDGKLLGEEEE